MRIGIACSDWLETANNDMKNEIPISLPDQIVRQQERINELEAALKWAAMHLDERFLAAICADEKNPVKDALAAVSNVRISQAANQ